MPRIFLFSPAYLRLLQVTNLNVFINLCIALYIFLSLYTRGFRLEVYFFVLFLAAISVAARNTLMKLKAKQQMVLLSSKGLFKKDGSTILRLDYRKILRIVVWEDRRGIVTAVHFITKDGKVKLNGFENMDGMLELMRPYVEDLVVVQRKRIFTNYEHLLSHLLFYFVAAAITSLYAFVPIFHTVLDYFIWFIPAIAVGVVFSLGKPLSMMWKK